MERRQPRLDIDLRKKQEEAAKVSGDSDSQENEPHPGWERAISTTALEPQTEVMLMTRPGSSDGGLKWEETNDALSKSATRFSGLELTHRCCSRPEKEAVED